MFDVTEASHSALKTGTLSGAQADPVAGGDASEGLCAGEVTRGSLGGTTSDKVAA
jgi:hypothetical protein